MRFIENGPSIPDELLLARDQGQVVFFCGSGVSRAKADLPDFIGLLNKVVAQLKLSSVSPVQKMFDKAEKCDLPVTDLVSADRLFGMLEEEFGESLVTEAVAKALQPNDGVDLSAHCALLDLATTPEGHVQLVTTNFDRLFDDCNSDLDSWQPPRLPDPLRATDLNGVVYLHGKASEEYTNAEGDGFVLSSSDFGRAYLADGWATDFFKRVIEQYSVVFVGYSAEDPPVQYLLEALRKSKGKLDRVYAFQDGSESEAKARWNSKGVKAISYSPDNDHAALWNSLRLWAVRARDIDGWYENIIKKSLVGPEGLSSYERGQVAHVVSSLEGIKRFSEGNEGELPPAEWLCVFDPHRRYAKPDYSGWFGENDLSESVDPFDDYCLDTDPRPNKEDGNSPYSKREAPKGVWDAFMLTGSDKKTLVEGDALSITGVCASQVPLLPERLVRIPDHAEHLFR